MFESVEITSLQAQPGQAYEQERKSKLLSSLHRDQRVKQQLSLHVEPIQKWGEADAQKCVVQPHSHHRLPSHKHCICVVQPELSCRPVNVSSPNGKVDASLCLQPLPNEPPFEQRRRQITSQTPLYGSIWRAACPGPLHSQRNSHLSIQYLRSSLRWRATRGGTKHLAGAK